MKCLSIRQPWANLIAHGIKDIENRTWKTNFRGRIYIHAPLKDERSNPLLISIERLINVGKMGLFPKWVKAWEKFEHSAIIGSVEIVNCLEGHYSIWADKECWNWVLKDPVLFEKPILNVKGKLSFWEYEDMR